MLELQYFFDQLAILGIALEIAGFWRMLKYQPTTKLDEYQDWMKKHQPPNDVKTVPFDLEELYEGFYRKREFQVPKKFANIIRYRRTGAIRLVIVGLVLQIVQIFGNDVISMFS